MRLTSGVGSLKSSGPGSRREWFVAPLTRAYYIQTYSSALHVNMSVVCVMQNDAVVALKRARQQYLQRCEELEKAKAMTAKGVDELSGTKTLDKRRKSQDEAQSKVKH